MCLQGERPFGVGEAILNGFGRETGVFGGVASVAGLEIAVARGNVGIGGKGAAVVDQFQFIAVGEDESGLFVGRSGQVAVLGRQRDPVNGKGDGVCTIRLDGHIVGGCVELVYEFAGDEERRFATSEDHALGWILAEGG